MKKKNSVDILVIGFALFSMFFGAGNIIFPPYLGLSAGNEWITAFISYYLADIGLAVLAMFAILKNNGNVDSIIGKVGKFPGLLMMSAIILCVGPLLAIPRTGATTFEMAVAPLSGGNGALITSIVYFSVILALTIKESAVVDIVGKFLTPALLIGLMVLIIKGIVSPIGPVSDAVIDNIVVTGVRSGYQTMDVLASLAFGIILMKTVAQKGYASMSDKIKIVGKASIVAAFGLLVVYCGLTYLGATYSTVGNTEINHAQLIVNIIKSLLGTGGSVLLGIVVALACITTAVALVSASAEYFSRISKGKLSYKALVIAICIFSTVASNIGLDQIISIASPILSLVYPGALTLIILSFFSGRIKNLNIYRYAASGAIIISLLEILYSYGAPFMFVTRLPLADFGFAWLIPAILCGFLGAMMPVKVLELESN
ncbi:MAG: branched-chain amino acid transport system II carrier protein [Lachnospiraceae bacterium]